MGFDFVTAQSTVGVQTARPRRDAREGPERRFASLVQTSLSKSERRPKRIESAVEHREKTKEEGSQSLEAETPKCKKRGQSREAGKGRHGKDGKKKSLGVNREWPIQKRSSEYIETFVIIFSVPC